MPAKRRIVLLLSLVFFAVQSYGQAGVRINEVLASNLTIPASDFSVTDWVELYNSTAQSVDLSDASLSDDAATPRKWIFPTGTSIPANGYLVVLLDSGRAASTSPSSPLNAGFSVKASGDTVFLYGKGASGALLDSVQFGLQAGDLSIGRLSRGWGAAQPTPGAENIAAQLGDASGVKVNEWMASPSSGDDWFELYNSGNLPVALGGLYLTDTLANKTNSIIPPLSYLGVGPGAYVRIWADSNPDKGADHANFKLSGSGEAIGVFSSTGNQIDYITFQQQTSDVSQGRLPDGSANIASFPNSATPGEPNLLQYTNLWVNELLSHTDPPFEDAVEFYNPTDSAVDISGWYLSNSKTRPKRYRLPPNSIVQPKGYFVVYEGAFNGPGAADPFTFNSAHGDQVYLAQADSNGNLTGYIVSETFESAENGVSFGRYQTSVPGDYKFVAMQTPTFGVSNPTSVERFRTGKGAANSGPKVGPVVVNEIMYNPPPAGALDNTLDEYIELYNITGTAVPLFDPNAVTNSWKLRDALSFIFPANSSIPAFGYALVVSFDPNANTAQRDAFRAKYNVPAQVQIFGPWSGKLNNSGDSVELYKPDPPQLPPHPDAGYVPYIRMDKLNFLDTAPWPSGASGTGNSLQRKNSLAFGNDPINWESGSPTAGRSNSPELQDSDADGLPDQWEDANGFNKNDSTDASQDADGDGFTNVAEYIAGTDPRNASSRLAVTGISGAATLPVIQFNTVVGKTYSLQYRNSLLPSTTWKTLETVDGTGGSVALQDTNAVDRTQRFYRVVTPATE